ncbi:hypothetical protein KKF34_16305 [Myxococcota bacterium]|nr:hypothetical protein [Myxococcota bacterium]MBU1382328.1 hypothetical protein [Myxococcota bacterium]MBU1498440.1 hypothetical protein [Myxococcota bacterium]
MKSIILFLLFLSIISCSGKSRPEETQSNEPSLPAEKVTYKNSNEFIKVFHKEISTAIHYLKELINNVHFLDDVKIVDFNRRCSLLLIQMERLQKEINASTIEGEDYSQLITFFKEIIQNISDQVEVVRKIAQNRDWAPDIRNLDRFIELRNEYKILEKNFGEMGKSTAGTKKLVKAIR